MRCPLTCFSPPALSRVPSPFTASLISRSPSLYRSLSASLGSGIHRHSEDGNTRTPTEDTSQNHRTCQTLRPLLLPLRPPFLLPAPASRLTWRNGRHECTFFSIGWRSLIVTCNAGHLWDDLPVTFLNSPTKAHVAVLKTWSPVSCTNHISQNLVQICLYAHLRMESWCAPCLKKMASFEIKNA